MRDPPEMLVVPFHPQAPSSKQEDVHEKRPTPVISTTMQNGKPVGPPWPHQTNPTPALLGKRAREEEMFHGFLRWVLAEHASIVAPIHIIVPSLQHIPGVQPIYHKQPPKHLELDRAFGFP